MSQTETETRTESAA